MRVSIISILSVFLLVGCESAYQSGDTGFITKLGNDTLAVETFSHTENGFSAKVLLRTPQVSMTSYEVVQDKNGGIESLSALRYDREMGFNGQGDFFQSITREGDSLVVEYLSRNGNRRAFNVAYEEGVLPFIDMVHWPYELALENAQSVSSDTVYQKLLSGSRVQDFIIAQITSDSMTIRHPSRGVMGVHVNDNNDLMMLDAGLTTRKLIVERQNDINIQPIAERFVEMEQNGKTFGALSGAVTDEFVVNGATFVVEYGSPKKRGRDLFGGIVPFGERWRTGANRATHFKTSADLKIGSLDVPAGEYTLFTIPENDGGTLIINKQTGQNGRSYDVNRDLGRVPMTVRTISDEVEDFTIVVEETDNGGEIQLIWGTTVYVIPFTM